VKKLCNKSAVEYMRVMRLGHLFKAGTHRPLGTACTVVQKFRPAWPYVQMVCTRL